MSRKEQISDKISVGIGLIALSVAIVFASANLEPAKIGRYKLKKFDYDGLFLIDTQTGKMWKKLRLVNDDEKELVAGDPDFWKPMIVIDSSSSADSWKNDQFRLENRYEELLETLPDK